MPVLLTLSCRCYWHCHAGVTDTATPVFCKHLSVRYLVYQACDACENLPKAAGTGASVATSQPTHLFARTGWVFDTGTLYSWEESARRVSYTDYEDYCFHIKYIGCWLTYYRNTFFLHKINLFLTIMQFFFVICTEETYKINKYHIRV